VRVVVKAGLSPVAVVQVEIDDGHALKRVRDARVRRAHGDVVE
jgi:hypothetical protein